jgi:hypothetical protein
LTFPLNHTYHFRPWPFFPTGPGVNLHQESMARRDSSCY